MQTFLVILIVLSALAAVGALVRGIIVFLQTTEADLNGTGPSVSGMRQNKMMRMRIMFQALAVIFVILLLMLSRSG
ncbi:twin transmembrane helix small protein [Sphingomonas solaris]|uniref:Twin transmembrane helix small protein n=1 Tax=Alterirhizorhabdus solaris TaxID=2529389 RepID=A0A558QZT6_9SPHN|nr:twin transmembrane helix small protein [Sphingomonas solaris]TVV72650.1 twin transmembrane helix small protein [Sphingomonas solaris]